MKLKTIMKVEENKENYQNLGELPSADTDTLRYYCILKVAKAMSEKVLDITNHQEHTIQNCNRHYLTPVRMAFINKITNSTY